MGCPGTIKETTKLPPLEPLLAVSALLFLAVLAGKFSGRFGLPALVLFLAIGMLAGSEGPGGIEFDDSTLASYIGALALAYILFSGGLDTSWRHVQPILTPGIVLATWGTLITGIVAGLGAVLVFDTSLARGLLIGAIISSTDGAAVFAILRSKSIHLKPRLRPLLEFESGSNDPMAVFLTIGLATIITEPQTTAWDLIWLLITQGTIGAVLGLGMAWAAIWLINRIKLEYEGLYPVLTLATVIAIFSVTAAFGGSGFLAVYLAGLAMARTRLVHKRSLTRFHDGVSWLMQITMFLILGLLVFPSDLPKVVLPGLALAAILILVARPIAVFMSLRPSRWSFKERTFLSWVGLRGAVPIILATFPLALGIEGADEIFNAVFFVVVVSLLLQGTTIPTAARILGVESDKIPHGDRDRIVGGATGRELRQLDVEPGSWISGRQIVELDLPDGVWLTLLLRDGDAIVPQGPTVLQDGDVLTILASPDEVSTIESMFA